MAMAMSIHFPSSQSLTFSSNSRRVSPLPLRRRDPKILGLAAVPPNPNGSSPGGNSSSIVLNSVKDVQTCKSSLEALFCYDKPIPEEIIEKPIGLAVTAKHIGNNPGCMDCQAKGAVLCATCSGTGLYVDSILESQGIIVKVRCLGCGGTGNIMCSECGGRGHL